MAPAATAQAGVAVTYVHPEAFSDANLRGGYGEKARAPALDGIALAQGEETISDMSYLMDASARLSSDSLRSEKTMLDDWFRKRFVRGLP